MMLQDKQDRRQRIAYRIIALALLGFAIAMAVIKATGMIQYDIELVIRLDPNQRSAVERIELDVFDHHDFQQPLSITMIRTQGHENETHPHRLKLPLGTYRIVFRLFVKGQSQAIQVRKEFEVNQDQSIVFDLP